jgi:hypothetical protein
MTVSISGTSGLVFNDASSQNTAATGFGFKNRIINGAMVIDQRNAGASVTPTNAYTLDRWFARENTDGAITVQQVTDAPTGFVNSAKITVTTADASIGESQFSYFAQRLEGFNISDFAFGTASASPITLSFWIKSSLTGTFGGAVSNGENNTRAYPFTYVISSANTWEQKSVTIAGDTSGSWATNNSQAMALFFGLGNGTGSTATAGAWTGTANIQSATGTVNLISTLSATWQITGVQLEKGSTATSFDYRPYSAELALCQRYCVNYRSADSNTAYFRYGVGQCDTTTNSDIVFTYPVPMRVIPTVTTTGTASNYGVYSGGSITACSSVPTINGASSYLNATINATVASGLTVGRACALLSNNNNTSYLLFSAEL